ncbi:MAG: hypothetical protein KF752_06245 [Pirellulaceae bacterium]|nr:hypothetical protein [Pirellulaceae bacterium]
MDLSNWLPRLPAIAALIQLPWFIWLSIVRVRVGGTSSIPLVKLIDLLIPLPACAGLLLAITLLWQASGRGIWLWGGGLACATVCAMFLWLLLNS